MAIVVFIRALKSEIKDEVGCNLIVDFWLISDRYQFWIGTALTYSAHILVVPFGQTHFQFEMLEKKRGFSSKAQGDLLLEKVQLFICFISGLHLDCDCSVNATINTTQLGKTRV